MSAFLRQLRCAPGLLALGLAFALVMGSLCPRGWFVCVHPDQLELVDEQHADGASPCTVAACCTADRCAEDSTGCLDFAVSLLLDDQVYVPVLALSRLVGGSCESLPGLVQTADQASSRAVAVLDKQIDSPPRTSLQGEIRLLI